LLPLFLDSIIAANEAAAVLLPLPPLPPPTETYSPPSEEVDREGAGMGEEEGEEGDGEGEEEGGEG